MPVIICTLSYDDHYILIAEYSQGSKIARWMFSYYITEQMYKNEIKWSTRHTWTKGTSMYPSVVCNSKNSSIKMHFVSICFVRILRGKSIVRKGEISPKIDKNIIHNWCNWIRLLLEFVRIFEFHCYINNYFYCYINNGNNSCNWISWIQIKLTILH